MTSLSCLLGFHSYPFLESGGDKTWTSEEFMLLVLCKRCRKPFDFSKARPLTAEEQREYDKTMAKFKEGGEP